MPCVASPRNMVARTACRPALCTARYNAMPSTAQAPLATLPALLPTCVPPHTTCTSTILQRPATVQSTARPGPTKMHRPQALPRRQRPAAPEPMTTRECYTMYAGNSSGIHLLPLTGCLALCNFALQQRTYVVCWCQMIDSLMHSVGQHCNTALQRPRRCMYCRARKHVSSPTCSGYLEHACPATLAMETVTTLKPTAQSATRRPRHRPAPGLRQQRQPLLHQT